MINSFAGLEMSRRALNAFRMGLQVAGHNASNVRTEGFSRQRVNLSTTVPFAMPGLSSPAIPGQIGTGSKIDEIIRIRDQFLDFQFRSELSALGYWSKINHMYNTVQLHLAEPAGNGVRAAFDSLWGAVQELQRNPESSAVRRSMVEAANTLGGMLDNVVRGLEQYSDMVNAEVKSAVGEINGTLHEIASLNRQIHTVQAMGQNPNDLLDKRDLLIERLSVMIDIEISEPFRHGNITGEFFLTLNGRTLVQGDHVRELVAQPFLWNNKIYYNVQVRDNEFDIVENTGVALALATGPEGVHQLNVLRMANGENWATGGNDPMCIINTQLTSRNFGSIDVNGVTVDGVVLPPGNGLADGTTRTFTVSGHGQSFEFTFTWDAGAGEWEISNSRNGDLFSHDYITVDALVVYMQNVFDDIFSNISPPVIPSPIAVAPVGPAGAATSFTITSTLPASPAPLAGSHEISVTGMAVILGMSVTENALLEHVSMRVRPPTITEPLGIATPFRIQVGTQGTQVTSRLFRNNPTLNDGDILGAGQPGDTYTFRIGLHSYQIDVTVTWNESTGTWDISSDTGEFGQSAGDSLTVADLAAFLDMALPNTGPSAMSINLGTPPTQFSIASDNKHLISISDVVGNLAAQMGMVNPNPVITIDVNENDSLEIIRNKINEKFSAVNGLTQPEQWVHAELRQDADQTWYLVITSNVAGEAQRITLMGDDEGNKQALRRLGLLAVVESQNSNGDTIFREVTSYSRIAEDAHFTFNGVNYLSSDNKFHQARRIPAGNNRNDFSASRMETVSEGIFLELKGVGRTAITVRHHVTGGSVKALMDIRDGLLPQMKAELDEIVWNMVNHFNALQFSGYGIGNNITTTGVAFFNQLSFRSGAASMLRVNSAINDDISLIGAATGVNGVSLGSGDGTNAARMASLQTSRLLNNGTASLGEFYETFLARIGSEAGRASLMLRAQQTLTDQIDEQRQSIMGVNIDEEMLDMLMFNHAFNAMSRYATAVDEMLDRIINGFGTVGR